MIKLHALDDLIQNPYFISIVHTKETISCGDVIQT